MSGFFFFVVNIKNTVLKCILFLIFLFLFLGIQKLNLSFLTIFISIFLQEIIFVLHRIKKRNKTETIATTCEITTIKFKIQTLQS